MTKIYVLRIKSPSIDKVTAFIATPEEARARFDREARTYTSGVTLSLYMTGDAVFTSGGEFKVRAVA